MIVHLIIVFLVIVKLIQLFTNLRNLNHSFLKPLWSFSRVLFHSLYNFLRKSFEDHIQLNLKHSQRCLRISWKRKVSAFKNNNILTHPLLFTLSPYHEFLSGVWHEPILSNEFGVFKDDDLSFSINSSALRADVAFEQAFAFDDEKGGGVGSAFRYQAGVDLELTLFKATGDSFSGSCADFAENWKNVTEKFQKSCVRELLVDLAHCFLVLRICYSDKLDIADCFKF